MDFPRQANASFDPARKLSVTLLGTGSGTITIPAPGKPCLSGTCEYLFPVGTNVSLLETATGGSIFDGWNGDCTGTGACTVLMDVIRSVQAKFTLPLPARINGATPVYYQLLQAAYDKAITGDEIQMTEVASPGTFTANRPISVRIKGGYNPAYTTNQGKTTVPGALKIQSGTVIIENVIVK